MLCFDEQAVRKAIFAFPPGSSGGSDGITPQHLKDLIVSEGTSATLLTAITSLVNLLVDGKMPLEIRPYFFGGRLVALRKKDGGVRPIVVGMSFWRLTSKLVSFIATSKLAPILSPLQVGVGVSRGVEAAVHATRCLAASLGPNEVLVKLDFANAFNSVRRDALLEAVAESLPEALPYIEMAYVSPSHLGYEGTVISSDEGVQQGDPLGPLLFCLAIHPILEGIQTDFKIGYLDDLSLCGDLHLVTDAVCNLRSEASKIGLSLNDRKCELISKAHLTSVPGPLADFRQLSCSEAIFLGAPLFEGSAMDQTWEEHKNSLSRAADRLCCLTSHDALVILKHALSLPKLLFILRCTYSGDHPALSQLDSTMRGLLCQILNVDLTDAQWDQATLPVKWGGIGIRKTTLSRSVCLLGFSGWCGGSGDCIPSHKKPPTPQHGTRQGASCLEGSGRVITTQPARSQDSETLGPTNHIVSSYQPYAVSTR